MNIILSDLKLAYCTNFWNHYQAPLCIALGERLYPGNFAMCVFESLNQERKRLGWDPVIPSYDWIHGPPSNQTDFEALNRKVMEADVAVLGSCPQETKVARVTTGKLTMLMGERLWKKPYYAWRMLNPRFASGVRRYNEMANRPNVHYLAMGAYAAEDVAIIGAHGNRVWAWPYFANVNPHPPLPRSNDSVRILWVGRMLGWKRVDILLRAVALIAKDHRFERLDIVGTGPKSAELRRLSKKLNLRGKVVFHDPMQPNIIREMMRHSHIYVLSSNRGEGWGVVANEAMSEGCVLVANEQAGASRELVEHGKTGFMFKDGSIDELADILKELLNDHVLRERVSYAGWERIMTLWHPRVGAERLIALCNGLLGKGPMPEYKDGPCRNVAVTS